MRQLIVNLHSVLQNDVYVFVDIAVFIVYITLTCWWLYETKRGQHFFQKKLIIISILLLVLVANPVIELIYYMQNCLSCR